MKTGRNHFSTYCHVSTDMTTLHVPIQIRREEFRRRGGEEGKAEEKTAKAEAASKSKHLRERIRDIINRDENRSRPGDRCGCLG
jgi:hypothetical protein